MGRRTWVKFWCLPWTEGTIGRAPIAVRGTFATLLALIGDCKYADTGCLKMVDNLGFPDEAIAAMLRIDPRTWAEHKTYLQQGCGKDALIAVSATNVISICSWEKFQSEYRRQRKYRRKKLQPKLPGDTDTETETEVEGETDIQKPLTAFTGKPPDFVDKARASRNPVATLIQDAADAKDMNK